MAFHRMFVAVGASDDGLRFVEPTPALEKVGFGTSKAIDAKKLLPLEAVILGDRQVHGRLRNVR